MLKGRPLFQITISPSWLLSASLSQKPIPCTRGASSELMTKVWVWLKGTTPLSRSWFEGSESRSSPLPTT